MKLSASFSLNELCKSQTASRLGIDNRPADLTVIANLQDVCKHVLQPVRDFFGASFSPSSGYRCEALNRAINGAPSSQHMSGQAADFEVPGISNPDLATWIAKTLDYDQLILEFYTPGEPSSGWVHCSYVGGSNRREILTIGRGYRLRGIVA